MNEYVIEKLSYHKFEMDNLSLDDCLHYLSGEWKTVRGRTTRQLILQITELLAKQDESLDDLGFMTEAQTEYLINKLEVQNG